MKCHKREAGIVRRRGWGLLAPRITVGNANGQGMASTRTSDFVKDDFALWLQLQEQVELAGVPGQDGEAVVYG